MIALRELGYDISVDLAKLEPIADHFRVIKDKYIKDGTLNPKMLTPDPRALFISSAWWNVIEYVFSINASGCNR